MEIRSFFSWAELVNIPGFDHARSFRKTDYKGLYGDYHFKGGQRCCFEHDMGKSCRQPHDYGYVVELTDGAKTLIGNRCAKRNFGGTEKFGRDHRLYEREKSRRELLARAKVELSHRQTCLDELARLKDRIDTIRNEISGVRRALGTENNRDLVKRAQHNHTAVEVEATYVREGVNAAGNVETERTHLTHTVGHLKGLGAFNSALAIKFARAYKDALTAYQAHEYLADDTSASELTSLLRDLTALDDARMAAVALDAAWRQFQSPPQEAVLCLLSAEEKARIEGAVYVLSQQNKNSSRTAARKFLSALERQICDQFGARSIRPISS